MTEMKIQIERIHQDVFDPSRGILILEGIGAVHKEGRLLGKDMITAKLELKGKGVEDIQKHFGDAFSAGFMGGGRFKEIIITLVK